MRVFVLSSVDPVPGNEGVLGVHRTLVGALREAESLIPLMFPRLLNTAPNVCHSWGMWVNDLALETWERPINGLYEERGFVVEELEVED